MATGNVQIYFHTQLVKTPEGYVTAEPVFPMVMPDFDRPKTPREVLSHAARYIEEFGWTRGRLVEEEGAACAVGAIMKVTGDMDLRTLAYRRLLQHLPTRDDMGTPRRNIESWNDDLGRQESEVIAALHWAAKPTVHEL